MKEDLTLEHIDPRNGELVCGLCNEFNEILASRSYNARKNNRFVPYRVCDYPPPITFGDIGEFLIKGEWIICEFGGTEWWLESNRVGNSCYKGLDKTHSHPNTIKFGYFQRGVPTMSLLPPDLLTKRVKKASHVSRAKTAVCVEAIDQNGDVFLYPSAHDLAREIGSSQGNVRRALLKGYKIKGLKIRALPENPFY
jgi:hypothetical protein